MSQLEITDVCVSYGKDRVLHGVNVNVPSGSITAVLGASGCGKTTLLRSIAGFSPLDRGKILVDGDAVASRSVSLPPEKRGVTIVPQNGALFPHLSVGENVGFGIHGWSRRRYRNARVSELLSIVGLEGMEKRSPHELSGGQQQRVALARALAPSPRVVLLDEPFSALDAGLREQTRAHVQKVIHDVGATALLVTHDQNEALSMADQVALLRGGIIAQAGTPYEMYARPVDPDAACFLGDAVLLPATAEDRCAQSVLGTIPLEHAARGEGTLMLRPEQIALLPSDRKSTSSVEATVVSVQFYGHDATLEISTHAAKTPLMARVAGPVSHKPGERVCLTVKGSGVFYH